MGGTKTSQMLGRSWRRPGLPSAKFELAPPKCELCRGDSGLCSTTSGAAFGHFSSRVDQIRAGVVQFPAGRPRGLFSAGFEIWALVSARVFRLVFRHQRFGGCVRPSSGLGFRVQVWPGVEKCRRVGTKLGPASSKFRLESTKFCLVVGPVSANVGLVSTNFVLLSTKCGLISYGFVLLPLCALRTLALADWAADLETGFDVVLSRHWPSRVDFVLARLEAPQICQPFGQSSPGCWQTSAGRCGPGARRHLPRTMSEQSSLRSSVFVDLARVALGSFHHDWKHDLRAVQKLRDARPPSSHPRSLA